MLAARTEIRTEKAREAGSEQQPENPVGIFSVMNTL
jgi:hypothetical protein